MRVRPMDWNRERGSTASHINIGHGGYKKESEPPPETIRVPSGDHARDRMEVMCGLIIRAPLHFLLFWADYKRVAHLLFLNNFYILRGHLLTRKSRVN